MEKIAQSMAQQICVSDTLKAVSSADEYCPMQFAIQRIESAAGR